MTINDSEATDSTGDDPVAKSVAANPSTGVGSTKRSSNSVARRQMIKSALAAVPVVLTITAGTAKAQAGSLPSATSDEQTVEEDSDTVEDPQAGSGSSSSLFSSGSSSRPFGDSPMGPLESGSGSDK